MPVLQFYVPRDQAYTDAGRYFRFVEDDRPKDRPESYTHVYADEMPPPPPSDLTAGVSDRDIYRRSYASGGGYSGPVGNAGWAQPSGESGPMSRGEPAFSSGGAQSPAPAGAQPTININVNNGEGQGQQSAPSSDTSWATLRRDLISPMTNRWPGPSGLYQNQSPPLTGNQPPQPGLFPPGFGAPMSQPAQSQAPAPQPSAPMAQSNQPQIPPAPGPQGRPPVDNSAGFIPTRSPQAQLPEALFGYGPGGLGPGRQEQQRPPVDNSAGIIPTQAENQPRPVTVIQPDGSILVYNPVLGVWAPMGSSTNTRER